MTSQGSFPADEGSAFEPGSESETDPTAEIDAEEARVRREKIEAGIEEIRERLSEAQATFSDLASDVGSKSAETAGLIADSFVASLRSCVRRQPVASVLVAAGIGCILSYLSRSK
jgi:ElaB/YqjD/DUF883 family membrane-anchored ribosome-binding protein